MASIELTRRGSNPEKLSDKKRRFCFEYPKDYNATRAAIAAGYSAKTAQVKGAQLLKEPAIKALIGKIEAEQIKECKIDINEVLTHLYYLATRTDDDFRDENGKLREKLNARAAACIDGYDQTETILTNADGDIIGKKIRTKVKLSPKAAGVDMAMKHKGLYAAIKGEIQHEHNVQIDWQELLGLKDPEDKAEQILQAEFKKIEEKKK